MSNVGMDSSLIIKPIEVGNSRFSSNMSKVGDVGEDTDGSDSALNCRFILVGFVRARCGGFTDELSLNKVDDYEG